MRLQRNENGEGDWREYQKEEESGSAKRTEMGKEEDWKGKVRQRERKRKCEA